MSNPRPQRLTPDQARLVRDNIGLVRLHVQRRVMPAGARPRRNREYDDLIQEGCLGLITAAQRFRPHRGIPFAAFALSRIRQAVSAALQQQFATLSSARQCKASDSSAAVPACPRVISLDDKVVRACSPVAESWVMNSGDSDSPARETIGERLGEHCTRAIRAAAEHDAARVHQRSDRAALVRSIIDERILEPDEASRPTLRTLARRMNSSFGRVTQCEQKLLNTARARLERDEAFQSLRTAARHDPMGMARPVEA